MRKRREKTAKIKQTESLLLILNHFARGGGSDLSMPVRYFGMGSKLDKTNDIHYLRVRVG